MFHSSPSSPGRQQREVLAGSMPAQNRKVVVSVKGLSTLDAPAQTHVIPVCRIRREWQKTISRCLTRRAAAAQHTARSPAAARASRYFDFAIREVPTSASRRRAVYAACGRLPQSAAHVEPPPAAMPPHHAVSRRDIRDAKETARQAQVAASVAAGNT